jgi:hypothetical protein
VITRLAALPWPVPAKHYTALAALKITVLNHTRYGTPKVPCDMRGMRLQSFGLHPVTEVMMTLNSSLHHNVKIMGWQAKYNAQQKPQRGARRNGSLSSSKVH